MYEGHLGLTGSRPGYSVVIFFFFLSLGWCGGVGWGGIEPADH